MTTKIYVVVVETFDGECLYYDNIRAFRKESDAENFATKCEEEVKRIRRELKDHEDKYFIENEKLAEKIVDGIAKCDLKETYDFKNEPAVVRQKEIRDLRDKILTSHKYHKGILDVYDKISYNIQELALE